MNTMRLPVAKSRVAGYGHHVLPNTIVAGRASYDSWFYSNYIQLLGLKEYTKLDYFHDVYIADSVFLSQQHNLVMNKMSVDNLTAFDISIVDFIKHGIRGECYVYLFVDEFYIPTKNSFRKKHTFSDALIYGFNEANDEFYIYGYNQDTMQFQSMTVLSEILFRSLQSFKNMYVSQNAPGDRRSTIYLLKPSLAKEHIFETIFVREQLEDYLYSRNTSERYRLFHPPIPTDSFVFGMDIYSMLEENLQSVESDLMKFKIVPFHVLHNHKENMKDRFIFVEKYYKQHFHGKKDYEEVVDMSLSLKNLLFKFSIKPKETMLQRSNEYLKKIRKLEHQILSQFLSFLKGLER